MSAKKATTKTAKPTEAATKKPSAKEKTGATKIDRKLSQFDVAVKVLSDAGTAMTTKAMVEAMATTGYWTSPGGQTP